MLVNEIRKPAAVCRQVLEESVCSSRSGLRENRECSLRYCRQKGPWGFAKGRRNKRYEYAFEWALKLRQKVKISMEKSEGKAIQASVVSWPNPIGSEVSVTSSTVCGVPRAVPIMQRKYIDSSQAGQEYHSTVVQHDQTVAIIIYLFAGFSFFFYFFGL